jgi:hypothetical protein
MNQKGEITLLSCLLILTFSSIVILCSLELRKSFELLRKRSELYLCAKETKGEFNEFMKFMGRTNWAIKNINRAGLIMTFIPGLQGAAMDAQKLKKYLQYIQQARVVSYVKTLTQIKLKSCPVDPRLFITPFVMGAKLLKRDAEGAIILRKDEWNYYFIKHPYYMNLAVSPRGWEDLNPKIDFLSEEKLVKQPSPFYSY